jgi:hypothetical protein
MSIVLTQLATRVRKSGVPDYNDGTEMPIAITRTGAALFQETGSKYQESSRLGQLYAKTTDAVATIAAALPTTTAAHTLWNGNGVGGKSLVLEAVAWNCTGTSGGAADMFAILGMLDTTSNATVPTTSDTATAISSLNGGTYSGNVKSCHTVTVVDKGWFFLGNHVATGALTATKGAQVYVPIEGMIIVRPTHQFCISIAGVGTTAVGRATFYWKEVQLDNQ